MTYGKGWSRSTRGSNPPKRIGGDSQGRGSRLNTTYYTTENTRWGTRIVPDTSKWDVTSKSVRIGNSSYGTEYTFTEKTKPVTYGGAAAVQPQPTPAPAPAPEQKKALLIHPLQDEVDKLKILSSLRSRFGGMGTAKSNNLPFKQRDNFIPMNIEGSVGLNIA